MARSYITNHQADQYGCAKYRLSTFPHHSLIAVQLACLCPAGKARETFVYTLTLLWILNLPYRSAQWALQASACFMITNDNVVQLTIWHPGLFSLR